MSQRQDTKTAFQEAFFSDPTFTIRAPRCVNLIGEHTNYNDGFVLPCAIDFLTEISIAPRKDDQIHVIAYNFEEEKDQFSSTARPTKSKQQWANYVRGVVDIFMQKFGPFPHGFEMIISSDTPQEAGLSFFASLEVAVGKALQMIYKFAVDEHEIALFGQQAENEFVGCHCSITGQLTSVLGKKDSALLIDCRSLKIQTAPMPKDLQLVIINSNIERGLIDHEYKTRRDQCEIAAKYFGVKALRDVSFDQLLAAEKGLEPVIFRRARHVVTENIRTLAAAEALKTENIAKISELMAESHASMRDDFEITVPAIDKLVELVTNVIGEKGGVRMTGEGFGGSVVSLLPKELLNDVFFVLSQEYPNHNKGKAASIYVSGAEDGAYVC